MTKRVAGRPTLSAQDILGSQQMCRVWKENDRVKVYAKTRELHASSVAIKDILRGSAVSTCKQRVHMLISADLFLKTKIRSLSLVLFCVEDRDVEKVEARKRKVVQKSD